MLRHSAPVAARVRIAALEQLDRPALALTDHLTGSRPCRWQIRPGGKRADRQSCRTQLALLIEQVHTHLHQRLQHLGGSGTTVTNSP